MTCDQLIDEELVATVFVFTTVTAALLETANVSITDWLRVPVSVRFTLIVKSPAPLVDAAAMPGIVALEVVAA